MISDINIIKPSEEDLKFANEVFEKSIRDSFFKEGLQSLNDFMLEEIEFKKNLLKLSITDKNSETCFLIAQSGNLLVGTISYGPCGKEIKDCTRGGLDYLGELGSLYILPEYQERGIGSLLIKALAQHLKDLDIEEFCLDSGYKRAQKKWQNKFGNPYKIIKDYWGDGSDHMIWVCRVADYI